MAILVTILKWIGILLLCLLGLLLFLVLAALFCPAVYRAGGELGEKLPEDMTVKLRARWLFPLVGFVLVYQHGELSGRLTLCGIPIRRFPGKEKTPEKPKPSRREKASVEDGARASVNAQQKTEALELSPKPDSSGQKEHYGKKEGILSRIRRMELRIRTKIKSIIDKIRSIPAFFQRLWEKLSNIAGIVGNADNRQAAGFVLRELWELLKKYGPRRVETDLSYSAGDPARTGQVLAGLSMLPFLYRDKVGIRPDFESEVFYVRGTLCVKGHIQAVHLLSAALHIYKNKQVKKFIQQVRS